MTQLKKAEQQRTILLLTAGVLLLAYTTIRAFLLSITWDEAFSWIEFARNGIVVPERMDTMSANNHLLNTALMIVSERLFGLSELALRIPALLAHALFLFYSGRLVKGLGNKWIVTGAFIIINVNPYLLDFFSLARGYGLSLGLMMAGLYHFYLLHTGEKKNTNAILSIVFACLAVLANYVLLNFCIVLSGLIVLLYLYRAQQLPATKGKYLQLLKGLPAPVLLTTLLLLFVLPATFKLKEAGALFFGGTTGFWSDTVSTAAEQCFYGKPYGKWLELPVKMLVLSAFATALVFTLCWWKQRQLSPARLFLSSLVLLVAGCCLATVAEHRLLGTLYLIDRTTLFLVVLASVLFVFLISELAKIKPVVAGAMYIAAAAALVHFSFSGNFSYVLEWRSGSDVKAMLSDLGKIKKIPAGKSTISIGIPLEFDPPINFYREKDNLAWLNTAWRGGTTDLRQDYFFLDPETAQQMNKDSVTIIKTFPGTGNVLARPRYRQEVRTVCYKKQAFENMPGHELHIAADNEFPCGLSYTISSSDLPGLDGVAEFRAEVLATDRTRDNLVMVIAFQKADGTLYSWQKVYVKDFIRSSDEWYKATFTCPVPAGAHYGDELKAYIWNPGKQKLSMRLIELKWLACKGRNS